MKKDSSEEEARPENKIKEPPGLTHKDYYTDSYGRLSIHEDMLKDRVRTETYKDAILHNKHLFHRKVVLDVGCGSGILSMFAAQAGAAKVIGVEMSSIADHASKIVVENGFEDVITILKGKLEDLELPDGINQVDIIISEWMGYCLLYESMLDSVIFARDKWLAPSGLVFPDRCTLFISGMEDEARKEEKFDIWEDLYGFKMSAMKRISMSEPSVEYVHNSSIVTTTCLLKEVDIQVCKKEDLQFSSSFHLEAATKATISALVTHFTVEFTHCHQPLMFSTGPEAVSTHWKQTVFYLKNSFSVMEGQEVSGSFRLLPNYRNYRDLDFVVTVRHQGEEEEVVLERTVFKLR